MRIAWLIPLVALACSDPARPAAKVVAPAPVVEATPPPVVAGPAGAPVTPSTVKRVVVAALTRPSGTAVTTTTADGTITVKLAVLENGRGPATNATLTLAADGTIASFSSTGHHEMGATTAESFTREGNRVRWKSIEEQGERTLAAPAFFYPISTFPEAEGLLVRALLKAGGKRALLPAGEATLEKIGDAPITANGETRTLTGYAITGLELGPTYTWMNPDGTWFGNANTWRAYVPEGWESAVAPLVARQNTYAREREQRIAATHAHRPPAAGLAYTNARVLDVERGRWLAKQTVVVVGDRITSVGATGKVAIPAGSETIDLAGRALLPGLIDMHVHLSATDGLLHVASGVTTVRDVGNEPDQLDDIKARFDTGTAVGPHVVRFGFIEGRNPKAAASKVTAETPEEAKAAVEMFAKRGYEGIKIYNSVRPELVPVITAAAHAKRMQVTGHIPVHMLAHEAVKAGYDGIEHVNMLFLNFFATHDTDTRDTTRFTLVGERAGAFDLRGNDAFQLFALLRKHQTVIDPTLGAFEGIFVAEQGKVPGGLEEMVARLPPMAQRWFLTGGLPMETAEKRAQYRAAFEKLLGMVKALYDAKVALVVGTDHVAGLMLHHELALYVRAGLSPATALQLATVGAARAMRMERTLGTIAVGKRADLVVVDGDPLADIRAIGAVVSTMRGGVVFPSAPLFEASGVRPMAAAAK